MSRKRRTLVTRAGPALAQAALVGAPQLGQFRHAASIGCRHCAQARRTALPQLAQKAWPWRAGTPQLGQGTVIGSRRMK